MSADSIKVKVCRASLKTYHYKREHNTKAIKGMKEEIERDQERLRKKRQELEELYFERIEMDRTAGYLLDTIKETSDLNSMMWHNASVDAEEEL